MSEYNFLLGEIASPFPAEILKKELDEHSIFYTSEIVHYADAAFSKEKVYVSANDSEKAVEILKKVEKDEGESNVKFDHPFTKFLKRIGPILVGIWVIWKIYSIFKTSD